MNWNDILKRDLTRKLQNKATGSIGSALQVRETPDISELGGVRERTGKAAGEAVVSPPGVRDTGRRWFSDHGHPYSTEEYQA